MIWNNTCNALIGTKFGYNDHDKLYNFLRQYENMFC